MEAMKTPDEGKNESPSQENIAHQFMKREVESLEDFEDITKDEPSVRDITAQFLQFETGDRNKPQCEESLFQLDDHFDIDTKTKDPEPNFEMNQKSGGGEDFMDFSDRRDTSPVKDTLNDLLDHSPHFEQTDFQNKEIEKEKEPETPPLVNLLDDNKLIDLQCNDEISTGSEDLSFIPKKGESSPVLLSDFEIDNSKMFEGNDPSAKSRTLTDFNSDSGMKTQMEHIAVHGDGLHIKDYTEVDSSDNEDAIPEPIPKDYPEIGAIEGKQFLAAIGLDTWFHPDLLNPKLESLVYWRDPKKSGIVFGSILVILLSLTSFSLISVIAYTSLALLCAALSFRIYKSVLQAVQKTSEGHPFKIYLGTVLNHPIVTAVFLTIEEYLEFDLTLSPDRAREISDVVVSNINKSVAELRRLFFVEDVIDSIKFGIILWCLTYVGAWFNGLSLLIIGYVGLFTLPKVYENNKTQIDANIDIVKSKINEVTEKIKAVIPMGKKTDDAKDKNE